MISREIVVKAIDFEKPDRLPLLFRTAPERSDIVCPSYAALASSPTQGSYFDEWGCRWSNPMGVGTGYVTENPLEKLETLRGCVFPNPRAQGRFDCVRKMAKNYPDKYIAGSMGLSGFSLMIALRGFRDLMIDLWLNRSFLAELTKVVWDFEAAIIEQYAECGVNAVWFYDDWGMDKALFINPGLWREIFKPLYREQFKLAHDKGLHVFFHSCGYVWDIIHDLVEIGVDCLNLEQPRIFDTEDEDGISRLARNFGGKVCFCTSPDLQVTLNLPSPDEISAEARHIVDAFGPFGGGLIALADCGKEYDLVAPANLAAMERAFVACAGSRAQHGT